MRDAPEHRKLRWYNKQAVDDNTVALNIIKNYCLDELGCWPVMVFAVTLFALQFLVSGSMLYLTAQLYSEGLRSRKFYRGGGLLVLALGALGLVGGVWWSRASEYPLAKLLVFSGSLMTTFASVPLAGFRGLIAGVFGGVFTGMALGTQIQNTRRALIWGAIAGLVSGGLLGAFPVFWTLDSVERYLHDTSYSILHPEYSRQWSASSNEYEEDE